MEKPRRGGMRKREVVSGTRGPRGGPEPGGLGGSGRPLQTLPLGALRWLLPSRGGSSALPAPLAREGGGFLFLSQPQLLL